MNDELERVRKKRPLRNSSYYRGIYLEGLRKTTRNPSQDSRSPDRELNPGPHEYEAEVLTTQPRRSVRFWLIVLLE
jgi:hypothetical protein